MKPETVKRLKSALGIVVVGGAMLAQAAVTPEVVDKEWRVTVEAGGVTTLTLKVLPPKIGFLVIVR